MIIIRSTIFVMLLVVLTPLHAIYIMLHFPFSLHVRRRAVDPWVNTASWLIEHLLGIRYQIKGQENIAQRPLVILSKHQSAWETILLQKIFPNTIFVWKREIIWIPFFGWALAVHPGILINRGAARESLRQLERIGKKRLEQGFSVVIFPEGTRVVPGQKQNYKIGGAHLAATSGAWVVPVALNSGECWERHAFLKRPGLITVSIGEPINPAGLTPKAINQRVEQWIENEMRAISPQLYTAHHATS